VPVRPRSGSGRTHSRRGHRSEGFDLAGQRAKHFRPSSGNSPLAQSNSKGYADASDSAGRDL
jgi:hypothetical protein